MVSRPRSATVMLETVPGILALLGRTAPRRPQRFSKPPKIRVVRGCFQVLSGCLGLPEVTSVAVFGGLLNLPALFVLTTFHLF